MNKFFKGLMLMTIATFSLTFSACGGDDKDEPGNPIENQSPDKFHPAEWVGIWTQSIAEYHPTMLLAADGRAIIHTIKMDNKWNHDFTWYDHYTLTEWTYDPDTKYLSVGGWIFEVTMKTPKSWSGIYTKGSKKYDQYFTLVDNEESIKAWWDMVENKN